MSPSFNDFVDPLIQCAGNIMVVVIGSLMTGLTIEPEEDGEKLI